MRSPSRGATLPTRSCCSCRGSSRPPSSSPADSSSRSSRAGPSGDCSRGCSFDRLALRTGASEMLRVAEMPSAELLVAKIVFWIVWIGFVVSAVDTLQFGPFQGLVAAVLPLRAALPGGAAGARARIPGRQLRLACHAARVGECRAAGRAPAQRDAAPPGDRDRGRHGARAAGAGDHRRADGICHRVRRVDAGAGDCVRARRARCRQAAARTASQRRKKRRRRLDAAPHL